MKKYGDKGDLGYIIKTQKLEGVKGKEFEGNEAVNTNIPVDWSFLAKCLLILIRC